MVLQPSDGGVFDHVARLSTAMAARGHEIAACGPLVHGAPAGAASAHVVEMGRNVSPPADLAAALRLRSVVARLRPDVVHAHSSKAGAVARLARAGSPRTPVIYTPHGYAFAGYFESALSRRAYSAAERLLAPLATRVLCVCEAERALAERIGPASRTRVVHNGIDGLGPGPGYPPAERARRDGPVIGAISLLRPGKGMETLIDAMAEVVGSRPDATLILAGDGPDRAALERRIAERGLGGSVRMVGALDSAAPLLRSIDVFAHPSWAESFPYAILQAMSLGLPIVATDVGGVAEAIADGESGLLVPPRDPAPLAAALLSALLDPERAAALGEAARARVAARFTLSRMVEGTLAVYGEVAPG